MELTTEALFLEELARGWVCEISQRWLEFTLEEVIGSNYIFWSVIKIVILVW